MKFGGASISSTPAILNTCSIIKEFNKKNTIVLVVSAMQGVTDQLYEVVAHTKQKKLRRALDLVRKIKAQHLDTLYALNQTPHAAKVASKFIHLTSRLENFVQHITKTPKITDAQIDFIVSVGERMSCQLIADALEANGTMACSIDTSYVIATNNTFGKAKPLYKGSQKHVFEILSPLLDNKIIPVISGFIGFAPDGRITTLGRGGSDLSASYLANLLNADGVYLWKDVDGFYSADPRKDPTASRFTKMNYKDAHKYAKGGAKILYPHAISPAQRKKIPIYIKSFIDPYSTGTIITE